jgi:hypothetical protein
VNEAAPNSLRATGRSALVILVAALCLGVAGAVVLASLGDRDATGSQSPGGQPGATGPGAATAGIPPRRGPVMPAGCGDVDPSSPPRLEFLLDGGVADYGSVPQGARIPMEVKFRNAGQGLLCVMRVNTLCGCLKARFQDAKKRRYKPGEEGVIVLMLDTNNREGRIEKSVSVHSNDLDAPIKKFMMHCDISLGVVAAPVSVHFGRHPRNTPGAGVLTLRSPKDDPEWKVLGVEGTMPVPGARDLRKYEYEIKPVADAKWRLFELTIRAPGMGREGEFRDPLVIRTTHPDRPRLIVQSFFHVVPRIQVVPSRAMLGYVKAGTPRQPVEIRLVPGSPELAFEITKVEVVAAPGRPPLQGGFNVTHGKRGALAVVRIQYDGLARKSGLLEAVVIVHTTDEKAAQVRIPVSATVR